jgi:drug/metabolite transporter (DMT)-like permease
MQSAARAQLELHFCVVLWGFTSILGKLISLPALALVWWRLLLVVVALLLAPRVRRGLALMPARLMLAFAGIGWVLALHWWTFYGAIRLANASVAVICIALAPVFVALIEPIVVKSRFDPRELVLGIAAVPGVALVVGGTPAAMRMGVVVGTLSALLVAGFSAGNKRLIEHADPLTVSCVEFGAGILLLTGIATFQARSGATWMPIPNLHDALLLVVLATVCTLLPFTLSLRALRHLTAYRAQLAVNMEPVYSIVLAVALLHEEHELSGRFYVGVAIILGVMFAAPRLGVGVVA